MWWSVELQENGRIFIQKTVDRFKHGAVGKVLLPNCLYETAIAILNENNHE
jgi:hypothetical protein